MSCDYSTYHTAVNLDPCSSPNLELGDCATARRLDLERRKSLNLKQGRPEHTADQCKRTSAFGAIAHHSRQHRNRSCVRLGR
jgi:hypothetical protein